MKIKLLTSLFILVWLEWRRSCHNPEQESWDHLIWKLDSFLILTLMIFIQLPWWFSTTLCIQIKLLTSRLSPVWLELRRSFHIPEQVNWDSLLWKWDIFFIQTHMIFIQLLGESPLFYVSKSSFLHRDSSWFD